MSVMDKRWSDLKTWQKIVFVVSCGMMIFGLIYLPIEIKDKMENVEFVDGISGCTFRFHKDRLSGLDCPDTDAYTLVNFTGRLDQDYTLQDYVDDYNTYMSDMNGVTGFEFSETGYDLNIS